MSLGSILIIWTGLKIISVMLLMSLLFKYWVWLKASILVEGVPMAWTDFKCEVSLESVQVVGAAFIIIIIILQYYYSLHLDGFGLLSWSLMVSFYYVLTFQPFLVGWCVMLIWGSVHSLLHITYSAYTCVLLALSSPAFCTEPVTSLNCLNFYSLCFVCWLNDLSTVCNQRSLQPSNLVHTNLYTVIKKYYLLKEYKQKLH